MRQILHMIALLLAAFSTTYAQVTTASVYGNVTDQSGPGLPGATVFAVHQPTGTQYGVTIRAEGQCNLPNVRVGGPYKTTVTYLQNPDPRKRVAESGSETTAQRQTRGQEPNADQG